MPPTYKKFNVLKIWKISSSQEYFKSHWITSNSCIWVCILIKNMVKFIDYYIILKSIYRQLATSTRKWPSLQRMAQWCPSVFIFLKIMIILCNCMQMLHIFHFGGRGGVRWATETQIALLPLQDHVCC